MPYVWFRCQSCSTVSHRWSNSTYCGRRDALSRQLLCGGRLVRCDPPPDPEPFSPAWLEQRAMAAAFRRD